MTDDTKTAEMTARAEGVIEAAARALPADPSWPEERETITGYQRIDGDPGDPAVPSTYWAPEIGTAWPVAAKVAVAVLRDIAANGFGPNPSRSIIPAGAYPEWCTWLADAIEQAEPGVGGVQ